MFEFFVWGVLFLCVTGVVLAYANTRDSFHPLLILLPMMAILYWYMPWSLLNNGSINAFLDLDQRVFVQTIFFVGVAALIVGCFIGGGLKRPTRSRLGRLPSVIYSPKVRTAGYVIGGLGFAGWSITIIGAGGIGTAFSQAYGMGWSDYGYIRDAQLALFPALMLLMPSMTQQKKTPGLVPAVVLFSIPWALQGLVGARRGPTFMFFATLGITWYLYRNRRPNLIKMAIGATFLGYLLMFLVTNRTSISLSSDLSGLNFHVGGVLTGSRGASESGSSGNEYVYGAGSMLNSEATGHFFWGRRYLAEILVRPIPRQLWPNKYADFGVPELEVNAGTGGKVFHETLGWNGAPGSAPGIIADLWIEFRWFAYLALYFIGWSYGRCWRNAVDKGGFWIPQYVVMIVLSLYLVMQTGEAVIFRFLILSVPIWCTSYALSRNKSPRLKQPIIRRVRAA
jgi:hypothetical protein